MAAKLRTAVSPTDVVYPVDFEKFEKEQFESLTKALSMEERAMKEKHCRSVVIGTHQEKGCTIFWSLLKNRFQLEKQNITCWKAAMVIHKVLRAGHPNVLDQSYRHLDRLKQLGQTWGQYLDAYSKLIHAYCCVICAKLDFHRRNPAFPQTLNFKDQKIPVQDNDINGYFQLAVEVFDFQATILKLQKLIFGSLDPSRPASATSVHCRVAPLVPIVEESAALYQMSLKLMHQLHSSLPIETLTGHRERFYKQYSELFKFYFSADNLQYLETLVSVPKLSEHPPTFQVGGQIVSDGESRPSTQRSASVPKSADPFVPPTDHRKSLPFVLERKSTDDRFRDAFGSPTKLQGFDFGVTESSSETSQQLKEKDDLIEQLMREVVELRQKVIDLERQHQADTALINSLKYQIRQLQEEIDEYKDIATQACDENVALKSQLNDSKPIVESKAESDKLKAMEEKFAKVKQMYGSLRKEHVDLLKQHSEVTKQVTTLGKKVEDSETASKTFQSKVTELEDEVEKSRAQSAIAESVPTLQAALEEQQRAAELLIAEKVAAERQMSDDLDYERHALLVRAVEEARVLILQAQEQSKSDLLSDSICSPEYFTSQVESVCSVATKLETAACSYAANRQEVGDVVAAVSAFATATSGVVLLTRSTSNTTSDETAEGIKKEGQQAVMLSCAFLDAVRNVDKGGVKGRCSDLEASLKDLASLAKLLALPEENDTLESIGDIVEEEMAVTSQTIEAAAAKIEAMLDMSRSKHTGVTLEVNERILDSCTELMKSIRILIERSKDLQREIVVGGKGASSAKEFYKRNHRWTEGLISAAKAVGWGASVLVDSADKVVQGSGKFEDLIVSSHEIAASTAQLVAASKVKASLHSERLVSVKAASRSVAEATAGVVASAKSGSKMNDEAESNVDYSKLSLTQAKRLEMDSQVRVLELESLLEKERNRLAELRRMHYHLAGASEGWEEEEEQKAE
ncbi:huntingtin-interacting protein 1-like [Corticium candelabrum]|uniref:huntingtin-interacting protein 1-like n=1 Tax=Corticium candelabrum TaxID=121492 RepID=UPI002E26A044|nr:huntingtin-interacting protein 1-like [Corticium candelabrum]